MSWPVRIGNQSCCAGPRLGVPRNPSYFHSSLSLTVKKYWKVSYWATWVIEWPIQLHRGPGKTAPKYILGERRLKWREAIMNVLCGTPKSLLSLLSYRAQARKSALLARASPWFFLRLALMIAKPRTLDHGNTPPATLPSL